MPIIPQYRAEGPAQPVAPAMESEQGLRVDASTALRGIASLADALGDVNQPMANVSPELGQASARGLQNLGQGVGNLGEAMFDVRQRIAEAWNFRKVSEAQDAMDREVGDFEAWKLTEPNPTRWEPEWKSRMERIQNDLLSGEDLSPAAKDQISARVITFGNRHGVRVGLDAATKVVELANQSNSAEITRAVRAGDLATVENLTQYAVDQGWQGADWAERTRWEASEKIREDALNGAKLRSETFALRGLWQEGRDEIANAPWETEDHRQNALANYNSKVVSRQIQLEVIERARDGVDPDDLIAELTAKDDEGNYVNHPELSPMMRAETLEPLYKARNDEYASQVEAAETYIGNGDIKTEEDLDAFFDGKPIDPLNRSILTAKLKDEFVKTEASIVDLMTKAAAYDPAKDVGGVAAKVLELAIDQTMGDDPRAEGARTILEKRKNGEPLTYSEDVLPTRKKGVEEQMHAAADYRIEAGKLEQREVAGKTLFIDFNQQPEEGDAARYEETATPFWREPYQKVGRIVEVNQADREDLLQGKAKFVTDQRKKRAVDEEVAKTLLEMQRRADTGKMTRENAQEVERKITEPARMKAAEKIVDEKLSGDAAPGTPPAGGSGQIAPGSSPEDDLQWLNNLIIPAQATM